MFRSILLAASLVLAGSTAAIAGGELWSYEGDTGVDHWGNLSPDWAVCGAGLYQSPIDLDLAITADLGSIKSEIKQTPLKFGLDGPTFAVPYASGAWIRVNGTRYELQQFHFHLQSEHTVKGEHYPMEGHLVLRAEDSDHANAVMGVFIKAGAENAMLKQFWGVLPRSANKPVDGIMVNAGDLLPASRKFYLYEGSMTTPGCRQGVRWFVLEQPVEASQAQIDAFIADVTEGETNNRPVQQRHGRIIMMGQ